MKLQKFINDDTCQILFAIIIGIVVYYFIFGSGSSGSCNRDGFSVGGQVCIGVDGTDSECNRYDFRNCIARNNCRWSEMLPPVTPGGVGISFIPRPEQCDYANDGVCDEGVFCDLGTDSIDCCDGINDIDDGVEECRNNDNNDEICDVLDIDCSKVTPPSPPLPSEPNNFTYCRSESSVGNRYIGLPRCEDVTPIMQRDVDGQAAGQGMKRYQRVEREGDTWLPRCYLQPQYIKDDQDRHGESVCNRRTDFGTCVNSGAGIRRTFDGSDGECGWI